RTLRSLSALSASLLHDALPSSLIQRTGGRSDASLVGVIVMSVALVSPLVLYWLIRKTGWGRFLFDRPGWAHLPGTPGSRGYVKPARKSTRLNSSHVKISYAVLC